MLENLSYLIAIIGSIAGATFFISKKMVCSERASDKALETCVELEKLIELTAKFERSIKKDCCGYVWKYGENTSKALSSDFLALVTSQIEFNKGN